MSEEFQSINARYIRNLERMYFKKQVLPCVKYIDLKKLFYLQYSLYLYIDTDGNGKVFCNEKAITYTFEEFIKFNYSDEILPHTEFMSFDISIDQLQLVPSLLIVDHYRDHRHCIDLHSIDVCVLIDTFTKLIKITDLEAECSALLAEVMN